MAKILAVIGIVMGFIFSFSPCGFSQETLTITTYYPSPYGSYKELAAHRMKIGTTYSGSGTAVADNNLIVEGNVGIGATTPGAKLDVQVAAGGGITNIAKFLNPDADVQTYAYIGQSLSAGRSVAVGFTDNLDTTSGYGWFTVYGDAPAAGAGLIVKKGGNVGIGTTSPTAPLEVNGPATGAIKIVDGNQQANRVLTSDANGLATWQNAASFDCSACGVGYSCWDAFAAGNSAFLHCGEICTPAGWRALAPCGSYY